MSAATVATFLACLIMAECREALKPMKSIPSITNSLVNLGKMDISFHFNTKDTPLRDSLLPPSSSFLFSKSEPVAEPCPCSNLRGLRESPVNSPTDILSKLLMSNDLFSFNKEQTSSTLCCDSHEHDEFVTFEIGQKHGNSHPLQPNMPGLPFIYENLFPRKPMTPPLPKPKQVEVFLFPRQKETLFIPTKKDYLKKQSIQIVGDKEIRNDFKDLKYRSSVPIVTTVKKDLTAQEKNDLQKTTNESQQTLNPLNSV